MLVKQAYQDKFPNQIINELITWETNKKFKTSAVQEVTNKISIQPSAFRLQLQKSKTNLFFFELVAYKQSLCLT